MNEYTIPFLLLNNYEWVRTCQFGLEFWNKFYHLRVDEITEIIHSVPQIDYLCPLFSGYLRKKYVFCKLIAMYIFPLKDGQSCIRNTCICSRS